MHMYTHLQYIRMAYLCTDVRRSCADRYADVHRNIPLQGDAEHPPHHAVDGKLPLMNVGRHGFAGEGVLERKEGL